MIRASGDHSRNVGVEAGLRFSMGFLRPRPHHHDIISVRQLMLGAAVLMLIAAPFYGDSLLIELPFELIGAAVLVSLSALTRAMEKDILTADAIVAGVGMCLYQIWALVGFEQVVTTSFVLREALVVIFIFIFYFSVMASRSMIINHKEKRYFKEYSQAFGGNVPKEETYVHSQIFAGESEDSTYDKREGGRPFKEGD
ncbi:MAG: hypothetical protein Q7S05_02285 [bacterium]|nr:hypothetical protein [bacterium]